jgi:hypothetical protein
MQGFPLIRNERANAAVRWRIPKSVEEGHTDTGTAREVFRAACRTGQVGDGTAFVTTVTTAVTVVYSVSKR